MIYTVTANPALDYIVFCPGLRIGELNRPKKEELQPGGKGLNVSMVLGSLGHDNTALGFIAGFTGEEIERCLRKKGVKSDFCRVDGLSRINIKLKSDGETEINGSGPQIKKEDVLALAQKLSAVRPGDVIVISGSAPQGAPRDIYIKLLEEIKDKDADVVLDMERGWLVPCLRYAPFLIKPNLSELSECLGREVTKESVFDAAKEMQALGARSVLVSMGADGAALLTEDGGRYLCAAAKGETVDTTGAGDSMVAGFIAGWIETGSMCSALEKGAAAGGATAFRAGMAQYDDIERVLAGVHAQKV